MAKKPITKADLVEAVVKATGITKKAATDAVQTLFDTITATLKKGGRVQITGFGTFETRRRKKRTARNPATGETITIPAKNVPVFRAGKGLKDAVAKK